MLRSFGILLATCTLVAGTPLHSFSQDAPATSPAPLTPKDTLNALSTALAEGASERVAQLLYAENETEEKMASAMAAMAAGMARLQRSAVAAFGAQGAREIVGDTDTAAAEASARIAAAQVTEAADTARVAFADRQGQPIVLIRVGGHWRIPLRELSRGADAAALQLRLDELAVQTKLIEDVAREIDEKKYPSAEEAADAWHGKMMQALSPPRRATTRPTTGPATFPATAPTTQPATRPMNARRVSPK